MFAVRSGAASAAGRAVQELVVLTTPAGTAASEPWPGTKAIALTPAKRRALLPTASRSTIYTTPRSTIIIDNL